MILRAAVLLAALSVSLAAPVTADPGAPEPGASCSPNLVGAMTFPAGTGPPVVCEGSQWTAVSDPYPVSDRWLTSGPAIQLHGQGRRNPSMLSGDWTATPLSPESDCRASQVAVVPGTPTTGPPRIDDGQPGRPLSLDVAPTMATIEISGACLWQKQDTQPGSGW